MPSTIKATRYFLENGVAFMPGRQRNAGGVLVSGLEMAEEPLSIFLGSLKVDGNSTGSYAACS